MSQRTLTQMLSNGNENANVILTASISKVTNKPTATFNIGTPNLRTLWVVQNIYILTPALFTRFVTKGFDQGPVERESKVSAEILVSSVSTPITAFSTTWLDAKGTEKATIVNIPRKRYVLEAYAPIVVPGGHDLSIRLTLETNKNLLAGEGGEEEESKVEMEGCELVTIVEQNAPRNPT
jgi:hypothetical protein